MDHGVLNKITNKTFADQRRIMIHENNEPLKHGVEC